MNKITVLAIMIYSDGISLFWKENETKYLEPSKLAKKFLGVPASVARMFKISGFIFNPKRRGLGV